MDDLHTRATILLRHLDQRYTRGRRALVEALAAADHPVTTAELVAGGGRMPQSTTYRNLAVLEQAGIVHRIVGSDDFARFELAEELTGRHHHHLVCVHCGAVEDFDAPSRVERSLADAIGQLTTPTGFRAHSHRLDVLGTCGNCTS